MRQREVWLQTNRLPVFCMAPVEIALSLKGGSYVDMRFREFGIETDCFPVLCNRSIQIAFGFQHKTYLVVRLGVARIIRRARRYSLWRRQDHSWP